jgi:hypothetical protein
LLSEEQEGVFADVGQVEQRFDEPRHHFVERDVSRAGCQHRVRALEDSGYRRAVARAAGSDERNARMRREGMDGERTTRHLRGLIRRGPAHSYADEVQSFVEHFEDASVRLDGIADVSESAIEVPRF